MNKNIHRPTYKCAAILLLSVGIFSLSVEASAQQKETKEKHIPIYTFSEIEPMFHPDTSNDTTYIFNFWATYCAPCIKELPHFEAVEQKHIGEKIKITLISLDLKSRIKTSLIPFIEKNKIRLPVVVLSDPDANNWINKIDSTWTGTIPATLFIKGKTKAFYEKEFSYEELEVFTQKFLQQ